MHTRKRSAMRMGSRHLVNGFRGGWNNPAAPQCSQTMPASTPSMTVWWKGQKQNDEVAEGLH